MTKFILKIALLSFLISDLPNDVRWVRESREYKALCENIFNNAYSEVISTIKNLKPEVIPYPNFITSLKNENSLGIQSITCSKSACIGQYSKDLKPFLINLKKLTNHTVQLIRKNLIDYSFSSNLDLGDIINHNYAIIIDIDETVLDNSNYQVMLNETADSFSQESWSRWVNKEEANLVPGAKEFLDKIRYDGVRVIYISNRMHKNLQPTINNLKNLEIYSEDDIYLLRKDKADKKPIRRGEVFNGTGRMATYPIFNVIAFLGDAYGDFPEDLKYEWGKHNFIFPNPMYGKW